MLWNSYAYLCQRCLYLWEPQGHSHGAVHLGSCGQCRTGLLSLAGHGVEGTETQMAMRLRHDRSQPHLGEGYGAQHRLDDGPTVLGAQGRHSNLRHRRVPPQAS